MESLLLLIPVALLFLAVAVWALFKLYARASSRTWIMPPGR